MWLLTLSAVGGTQGATNGWSLGVIRSVNSAGAFTYSTIGYSTTASTTASSLGAVISTTTGTTSIGNNSTSFHTGLRGFVMPWASLVTNDDYWFGMINVSSSTSSGSNRTVMSASQLVMTNGQTSFAHMFNTANISNSQWALGNGVYSAATTGFPASIAFTQINNVSNMSIPAIIKMEALT